MQIMPEQTMEGMDRDAVEIRYTISKNQNAEEIYDNSKESKLRICQLCQKAIKRNETRIRVSCKTFHNYFHAYCGPPEVPSNHPEEAGLDISLTFVVSPEIEDYENHSPRVEPYVVQLRAIDSHVLAHVNVPPNQRVDDTERERVGLQVALMDKGMSLDSYVSHAIRVPLVDPADSDTSGDEEMEVEEDSSSESEPDPYEYQNMEQLEEDLAEFEPPDTDSEDDGYEVQSEYETESNSEDESETEEEEEDEETDSEEDEDESSDSEEEDDESDEGRDSEGEDQIDNKSDFSDSDSSEKNVEEEDSGDEVETNDMEVDEQ